MGTWNRDIALNTLWYNSTSGEDPTQASGGSVPANPVNGAVAVNTGDGKMWVRVVGGGLGSGSNLWEEVAGAGGGGSGDITGVTLAGDSGTAEDLTANVNLTIAGGTNVTTAATGTTLTINASGIGGTVGSGTAYYFPFYTANGTTIDDNVTLSGVANQSPILFHPVSNATLPNAISIFATQLQMQGSIKPLTYNNTFDLGNAAAWWNDVYAQDFNMQRVVSGSNLGVTLTASASLAASYSLTFPAAAPTNGYFLQSDASGNLSWSVGSGVTSVAAGAGLSASPSPIVGAGTLTLAAHNHESGTTAGGTLSATNAIGSGTLPVARGGTGNGTLTDKAVVITQDSGTDTLTSTAMDASGELLIGGTSGPAVGTLTAGDNITITNTNGGIEIEASAGSGTVSTGVVNYAAFYTGNTTTVGASSYLYSYASYGGVTLTGWLFMQQHKLQFRGSGESSDTVGIHAPTTHDNWTLTLPANDGTSNQFLQTNGSGVTSWATATLTHPDPHRLGNGGAASPTYSFSSETNSGFYREAYRKLGLVTNGQGQTGFDGNSGRLGLRLDNHYSLSGPSSWDYPAVFYGTEYGHDRDTGFGYYSSGSYHGTIFISDSNTAMIVGYGSATYKVRIEGGLQVIGAVSKTSGSFKIAHPLDEDNKTLVHGFVESPRHDLIYRGTATLSSGTVTASIDTASSMTSGTFVALTKNPEIWVQNKTGWAVVRGQVSGGNVVITSQDSSCTDTVAWLVMAERNDTFIRSSAEPWTDGSGNFIPEWTNADLISSGIDGESLPH